jgi:hypothetical protein
MARALCRLAVTVLISLPEGRAAHGTAAGAVDIGAAHAGDADQRLSLPAVHRRVCRSSPYCQGMSSPNPGAPQRGPKTGRAVTVSRPLCPAFTSVSCQY